MTDARDLTDGFESADVVDVALRSACLTIRKMPSGLFSDFSIVIKGKKMCL